MSVQFGGEIRGAKIKHIAVYISEATSAAV
jgi:hypothetical protein